MSLEGSCLSSLAAKAAHGGRDGTDGPRHARPHGHAFAAHEVAALAGCQHWLVTAGVKVAATDRALHGHGVGQSSASWWAGASAGASGARQQVRMGFGPFGDFGQGVDPSGASASPRGPSTTVNMLLFRMGPTLQRRSRQGAREPCPQRLRPRPTTGPPVHSGSLRRAVPSPGPPANTTLWLAVRSCSLQGCPASTKARQPPLSRTLARRRLSRHLLWRSQANSPFPFWLMAPFYILATLERCALCCLCTNKQAVNRGCLLGCVRPARVVAVGCPLDCSRLRA